MKKIFNYICLASLLALGTACQDDNLVTKENGGNMLTFSVSYASDPQSKAQTRSLVEFTDEDGKPTPFDISLSVEDTYAETPITRGTPISTLDDFTSTVEEFRAWGYYNNAAWTDVEGSKIKKFAGADYRPVAGLDDHEINAYIPSNTNLSYYRFYAIYPYDTDELTARGASVSDNTRNGYTITYTSPDNGDNDAVAQKEVLAGYMKSTTSMSVVPITFQPILSAIQFRVSDKQLGRNVTIKSIELHMLYNEGTCKVSKDGLTWTPSGSQDKTFVQTFDYDIDKSSTGGSVVGGSTKTFLIIPQTGLSDIDSNGDPLGTRIVIKYKESGESDLVPPHEAVHLLFGQKFDAGKTYIYNIGDFEGSLAKMEPWVEFSKLDVNDMNLVKGANEIHEENNSKFIFDFAQKTGTYEKAYFKIHNLEVGHWYSIEFTENLSLKGRNNTPFGGVGTYACRVSDLLNKAKDQNSMIAYYGATENYDKTDTEANPPFVWQHPDNKNNSTVYTSLLSKGETAKLTFYATQSEMYWVWDYSIGDDNRTLRAEIYMPSPGQTIQYYDYHDGNVTNKTTGITFSTGEKIKDITPKAGDPTVDFLNATLYNTYHSGGNNYGNSSNKSYAVDATAGTTPVKGTLICRIRSAGTYARVNVPLKNLIKDKKYKITYTLDKNGTAGRAGAAYHVGCIVQNDANTAGTEFNTSDPYIDYTSKYNCRNANFTIDGSANGKTGGETIEFTASTTGEMYWVWDFSVFNSGNNDHQFITFKDVTIEEVVTP